MSAIAREGRSRESARGARGRDEAREPRASEWQKMRWLRGGADGMEALYRETATSRLRHLDLGRADWRGGDMALLAGAPFADSLFYLSLALSGADDEDMEVLAASGRFARLRH